MEVTIRYNPETLGGLAKIARSFMQLDVKVRLPGEIVIEGSDATISLLLRTIYFYSKEFGGMSQYEVIWPEVKE